MILDDDRGGFDKAVKDKQDVVANMEGAIALLTAPDSEADARMADLAKLAQVQVDEGIQGGIKSAEEILSSDEASASQKMDAHMLLMEITQRRPALQKKVDDIFHGQDPKTGVGKWNVVRPFIGSTGAIAMVYMFGVVAVVRATSAIKRDADMKELAAGVFETDRPDPGHIEWLQTVIANVRTWAYDCGKDAELAVQELLDEFLAHVTMLTATRLEEHRKDLKRLQHRQQQLARAHALVNRMVPGALEALGVPQETVAKAESSSASTSDPQDIARAEEQVREQLRLMHEAHPDKCAQEWVAEPNRLLVRVAEGPHVNLVEATAKDALTDSELEYLLTGGHVYMPDEEPATS